ncbi:MAG: PA14 domain-containing protein, partial [Victivallales bacterium]
ELQDSTEQFWTGAYIIEGRLGKVSEEKDLVEISVFVSRPGQEKLEIIRQTGKLSEPLALVNALSDEILKKMGQRADGKLESWKVETESNAYANEAFWAYRAGLYEASRAAADAAMALGNDNPNLKFINVKSHLAEFAESSTFSYNIDEGYSLRADAVIRNELITREKLEVLINGLQACKEFISGAPGNASRFSRASNDWRLLCAESLSCAGIVLDRTEGDARFQKEVAAMRKLCRDFVHLALLKGRDSDLIFPLISLYIDSLPSFSDNPDGMFEEYKWILSLDFPALPDMRMKIRDSILYTHSIKDSSTHVVQPRQLDDWFKQAEKDIKTKMGEENIQQARKKRLEWCDQVTGSSKLSDRISGYMTRKSSSDTATLIELYNMNFAKIATRQDSYDCAASILNLTRTIPGHSTFGVTLGTDIRIESYCNVFLHEDPAKVDLDFMGRLLFNQIIQKIRPDDYVKISQAWQVFKKRMMKEAPSSYLMNIYRVFSIDERIEKISRSKVEGGSPFAAGERILLEDRIEIAAGHEYFSKASDQGRPSSLKLKRMSYEHGKLLVWGTMGTEKLKLPVMYSINLDTHVSVDFVPPMDISGRKVGSEGIFITSEKILYYVDEHGLVLSCEWGNQWSFVADAHLENPTSGCHAGESLFVAFGKDTRNPDRTSDIGWRADIIEIPDGSTESRVFASNTRRPKIAKFDDCRPYETMTMFASPDGKTLFFGTYMRPCYKLFYCDLKNPLEWKTSLHNHTGGDSRMYDNPYAGGFLLSCICGHTTSDLKFSKGSDAECIFELSRSTLDSGESSEKSCKWRIANLECQFYNNNGDNSRGSAYNGRELVFFRSNYVSVECPLLCFVEGVSSPYRFLIGKLGQSGANNMLNDVSLASSDDCLFIYEGGGNSDKNSCVWFLKWNEIRNRIKTIPATPEIRISPAIFLDSAQVTMSAAKDEIINYCIDSMVDEKKSVAYKGPFEMKESGRITAYSVRPGPDAALTSIPKIRDCLKMPLLDSTALKNPVPGLNYCCWNGAWENLPVFDNIKPASIGNAARLDLASLGMKEYSAVKYSSFIKIPADGLYTFNIDADSGVIMKINGMEVHRRPAKWSATLVEFKVGLKAGFHPVEIYYIMDEGDLKLKLEWEGPG